MWTERIKVINDYNEIVQYIESMDCFHDFRLGHIAIIENKFDIFVEEYTNDLHNSGAHIWNFSFGNISDLKIKMDCALPSIITEIEIKSSLVTIGLTNGYISFRTNDLSLGIPKM